MIDGVEAGGEEYEGANTELRKHHSGIIVAKYNCKHGAIFRVLCPHDKKYTFGIMQELRHYSPVKISLWCPNFQPDSNFYEVHYRDPQAIYNCQWIVDNINSIMGKRGMSYFRKYNRDCSYQVATQKDADDMSILLIRWRDGPGGQKKNILWHRSNRKVFKWLKEGRSTSDLDIVPFIAYRSDTPVAMSVVARYRIPGYESWGVQFIAKALNYKSSPGGGNNMSAWELYKCCQWCSNHGIMQLNGGGYNMHQTKYQALRKWKERFAQKHIEGNQWKLRFT